MRHLIIVPTLRSTIRKLLGGILFWGLFIQISTAQRIIYEGPKLATDKDSVKLTAVELIPLDSTAFQNDSLIHPTYRYLWIFGDGNFVNGTPDSIIKHRYKVPEGVIDTFEVSAYSIDTYSGGDPPPVMKRIDVIIEGDPDTISYQNTTALEEGRMLNLQKSSEIRPGDKWVSILSFKPMLSQEGANSSGSLLLFYNSKHKLRKAGATNPSGNLPFLSHQKSLVYSKNISGDPIRMDSLPGPLGRKYENVLVFNYKDLTESQEQHLFLEFNTSGELPVLGQASNSLEFLAVLTSRKAPGRTFNTAESLKLAALELEPFVQSLTEDTSGLQIVDFFEMEAEIVPAHLPNQLSIQSCPCPDELDQYAVELDLFCQNNGPKTANSLIIAIQFPKGIDWNSIDTNSIAGLPDGAAVRLQVDEAQGIAQWQIDQIQLQSSAQRGYDHPTTQQKIQFRVKTTASTVPEQIEAMRAAIRFNGVESKAIYTLAKKIKTRDYTHQKCRQCQPKPVDTVWLWLVGMISFLLFFLYLFFQKIATKPKKSIQGLSTK